MWRFVFERLVQILGHIIGGEREACGQEGGFPRIQEVQQTESLELPPWLVDPLALELIMCLPMGIPIKFVIAIEIAFAIRMRPPPCKDGWPQIQ